MAYWQIVAPTGQDVDNLCANPSAETDTTGYTAGAGTLARDATYQRRGVYALKYTPTSTTTDGFHYTVSLVSGVTYYASVDFRGAASVGYTVQFATTAGAAKGTAATFTAEGEWEDDRPTASYTAESTASYRVYFKKTNSSSTAPFYVDGVLIATSDYTYFDGDTPGAYWQGASHGSKSTLRGKSRSAGVLTDLAVDIGDHPASSNGIGMPPIMNVMPEYGLANGAHFQRQRAGARQIMLTVLNNSTTRDGLHALRRDLINVLKPDLTAEQSPFILRYSGADKPQVIGAVYDSGLEMNDLASAETYETCAIKFVCPDPFWKEDGEAGAALTTAGSVGTSGSYGVMQRAADGIWTQITALNGLVNRMEFDEGTGRLYVGGEFTAPYNYIFFLDTTSGSVNSMPNPGKQVNDIAIGADGTPWIASGSASQSGSVAYLSGSSWATAGSTAAGDGVQLFAVHMHNDGTVYTGGRSLAINGVSGSCAFKLSGSTWTGLAWPGNLSFTTAGIYDIISGNDDLIYVASTGSPGGVWTFEPSTSTWTQIGVVNNNNVGAKRLRITPDGILYAFGNHGGISSATSDGAAKYQGNIWSNLGTGIYAPSNAAISDAALMPDGSLPTIGNYVTINDMTNSGIATWNKSTWIWEDWSALNNAGKIEAGPYGKLFVASSASGSTAVGAVTACTNSGTASTHPIVKFAGPGKLYRLANATSGDTISFNLTLLAGETATLDLTPGNISFVSSFRGNILGTILPGSRLTTFKLLPGANSVSCFIGGTTSAATACTMRWPIRNWSADGGAAA